MAENLEQAKQRYGDYLRWVRDERAKGYDGLLMPYDGCTRDAVVLAEAYIDSHDKLAAENAQLREELARLKVRSGGTAEFPLVDHGPPVVRRKGGTAEFPLE